MNWYTLIQVFEPEDRPFYVSRKGDLGGYEWWDFASGKPIEDWTAKAWIQPESATEDGPPDDGLVNHFGLLIFSSRMRIAFENVGISGVQYLPLKVLKFDGTEYPGYSIANILNVAQALDQKASDFSVYPQSYFVPEQRGCVSRIRKAVLKRAALRSFHIIRLMEFLVDLYVSQLFVDTYNKHKSTGYSFSKVQTTAGDEDEPLTARVLTNAATRLCSDKYREANRQLGG